MKTYPHLASSPDKGVNLFISSQTSVMVAQITNEEYSNFYIAEEGDEST
jgi:hypothetical protein